MQNMGTHSIESPTFDIDDLDLGALSVTTMTDSAALPETGASYQSSSTCIILPGAE